MIPVLHFQVCRDRNLFVVLRVRDVLTYQIDLIQRVVLLVFIRVQLALVADVMVRGVINVPAPESQNDNCLLYTSLLRGAGNSRLYW